MSRFGYLRDPLFLIAVAGYVLNRWLLKPLVPSPFLHGHFNDLLLIPAALLHAQDFGRPDRPSQRIDGQG